MDSLNEFSDDDGGKVRENSTLVGSVYQPTTTSNRNDLKVRNARDRKDTWFLYLTGFAANLVTFVSGISLSWTSPVIPKFNTPDSPFDHPVTTTQEAWIASLLPLGATIGPFTAGYCADKFGRKKALLFLATPLLVAYLILSMANSVNLYYFARFIGGIGVGSAFGMVPMYLGEVTESHNRGKYGVMVGVFITFGLFYPFAIGPYLPLVYYSLTCTIPLIVFLIFFTIFMPESPYYLAAKGDTHNASKALMKLRGSTHEEVQKELTQILKAVEEDRQHQGSIKELFKNPALKRSLIMGLGLVILAQLDGINPVLAFLKPIFEASGSKISPNICTAIIGCIEITANGAAIFFVEKIGRRLILHISSIGCLISMIALGVYFYLKTNDYDVTSIFWLPIACMVIYNMFFSMGLGPVVLAISGEIFPSHVKGIASALAASATFLTSSVMCFLFPILSESIGMAGCFWIFAVFCVLTMFFVHFVLIETRGKSLAEIQKKLSGLS